MKDQWVLSAKGVGVIRDCPEFLDFTENRSAKVQWLLPYEYISHNARTMHLTPVTKEVADIFLSTYKRD